MKELLLASVSTFALIAGGASAGQSNVPMALESFHKAVHFTPRNGSSVLYDQTYSSDPGWVPSVLLESSRYAAYDSQAADDFTLPGTQTHKITAIYAPGENAYGNGYTASNFQVTFYRKIKSTKHGMKIRVLASCPNSPASAITANGHVLIDVSSCGASKGVKVKSGIDYSLSVQAITPAGHGDENFWYWYTIRWQAFKMGWWQNPGGGYGFCKSWEPMKTCYPTSGVGPDMQFELLGK